MTLYAPGTPQEAIDADQALQVGTWQSEPLSYPLPKFHKLTWSYQHSF
jgi:hypothetical protein